MNIEKEALAYHGGFPAGKLEVRPTKPIKNSHDLSLAYTPGVGAVCKAIESNKTAAYQYTSRGNLVAVVTNGTAVLGYGNIGPLAAKPVMEGKATLFKKLAGIDAFDIEINERDPEKLVQIVKSLEPTFGGVNLEDIKAPECFYIEEELQNQVDIPVMHDDQHGTAVVTSAALTNALQIAQKSIGNIKIVVNGAGSGAIACAKLLVTMGAKKEGIIMLDSKGVINNERNNLPASKAYFATDNKKISTLTDAIKGADVFLGLSKADVLTVEDVKSMSSNPIVFALANPNPEIKYELAMNSRNDIIFSTGRSDYHNQVNNTLCFPFLFRGALDVRANVINKEMKLAAVDAIAKLAHEEVPKQIKDMYSGSLSFGSMYILPKPMDPRLITTVSTAVAKAAIQSGVAKNTISNWARYEKHLEKIVEICN